MYWIEPYLGPWVFIVIVLVIIWRGVRDFYLNYSNSSQGVYATALIGWLSVGFVLCNLAIYTVSAMGSAGQSASFDGLRVGSYTQAAAEFGLVADQQYPLAIGDSLYGGTVGTDTVTAGLFTATHAVDLRPATSVSLNFSYEGRAWTTTVPTELIEFHTDKPVDQPPTMAVDFKPGGYSSSNLWDNETEGTTALSNGALGYVSWFVHPETSLNEAGLHAGLAPVVNQGVSHVDIWLSPELFKQITGQI